METLLYALNGNFGPGGITAAVLAIGIAVSLVLWGIQVLRELL